MRYLLLSAMPISYVLTPNTMKKIIIIGIIIWCQSKPISIGRYLFPKTILNLE